MDLPALDGVRAQVRTFAAGETHRPHRDATSRISILLRGGLAEDAAWGSTRLAQGDVLFKSREIVHEDRFGPQGASIFSVLFDGGDECPFDAARLDGAWLPLRTQAISELGLTAIEAAAAGDSASLQAAVADLLACAPAPEGRGGAAPWLIALYRALQDASLAEIDVGADARAAGRHPVTVSRAFRRQFGMTITEHAARQNVRRALVALARGDADLAAVAVGAGFYDQSHMNRVFVRLTRRTPGAHRALIAAAAA